jgi:2TM domain
MLHDVAPDSPAGSGADQPASSEELARQEAIKQIQRKRRFWTSTVTWAVIMVLVTVIWAFSEYHNAGGWPTGGFSESSGIPNVWNYWIIYPLLVWVLLTAADAWRVFRRKSISEAEIKHEMERQAGQR